jgi:CcmD family protein
MISTIKRTISLFALLLLTMGSFAQDAAQSAPVEMATGLYQSGKIYVVVIVLSVIMAGIAAYLIMLDRKVSRLEKEIGNKA